MHSRLLLGALVLLLSPLCVHSQDQNEPISRPRRTQPAPAETDLRQAHSAKAESEAKRLYKDGVKYEQARLYRQAAETLEQAVKLKPDYADAYLSLGRAYYELHKWELAVARLQRGLELKPGDKESQRRLTQSQKRLQEINSRQQVQNDSSAQAIRANGASTSLPATEPVKADSSPRLEDEPLTTIYRVGPGDVLDVHLTDEVSAQPTLFTVSAAGLLEHPSLKAPLACAGRTVDEIASAIQNELKTGTEIKNVQVSVAVEEYISHTILVSGLVKEPGTKSLKREGIPLYVVIADAQALPEAGRVSVQRSASNENFLIDLSDTSKLTMLVRPGDVIVLSEQPAQFFYVSGRVNAAGEKPFHRGLTLTQAIMAAGGLTKDAREAEVSREAGQGFLKMTRYKLKEIVSGKIPDPGIQPGDRINIVN